MKMRQSEGFTITELLVSMFIGSMIIGFVFTAYLFSQKLYGSWNKENEIKVLSYSITSTIAKDIRNSKKIVLQNDSTMMLEVIPNRIVQYSFSEYQNKRNDVSLNEDDQKKIKISVVKMDKYYTVSTEIIWGKSSVVTSVSAQPLQSSQSEVEKEIHYEQ